MALPEDAIHLMSVVVAGVISQTVPNSRCALMIVSNIIVLIGAVLVGSKLPPLALPMNYLAHLDSIARFADKQPPRGVLQ